MEAQRASAIRVMVAGGPSLLREIIVGAVGAEADLDLVNETPETRSLSDRLEPGHADVVVLIAPGEPELRRICEQILDSHPRVRCIAVLANGRKSFLQELWPREVDLGNLSPAVLVEAIRGETAETTLH